jgi:small neutral amino acid transporter SnatA (MarC family)
MRLAVFPFSVPYLLDPVGIVILVTTSAEAGSIAMVAIIVGVLAGVLALDAVVFRRAVPVSSHLDPRTA